LDEYNIIENEIAQDGTVPYEIKFTLSINKENYTKLADQLAATFQGLGGTINERFDVVTKYARSNGIWAHIDEDQIAKYYNEKLRLSGRNGKDFEVCFGISRFKNNDYSLDHYCFPSEWMNIYPWNINSHKNYLPDKVDALTGAFRYGVIGGKYEISIRFLKEDGSLIFEEMPQYGNDYQFMDYIHMFVFKWRDSGGGSFDHGLGNVGQSENLAAGFNIGPFIGKVSSMFPSITIKYKGKLKVPSLYDINKVEIIIREKAK
jgi:hypothetical protein